MLRSYITPHESRKVVAIASRTTRRRLQWSASIKLPAN